MQEENADKHPLWNPSNNSDRCHKHVQSILFSSPPPSSPLTCLSNTRPHPFYPCAVSSSCWSRVPRGAWQERALVCSAPCLLQVTVPVFINGCIGGGRGAADRRWTKNPTAEFCCAMARAWGPSGKICPCLCQHSRFFVDFLHFSHSQVYCAIHELLSAFFFCLLDSSCIFLCALRPPPPPFFFFFLFFLFLSGKWFILPQFFLREFFSQQLSRTQKVFRRKRTVWSIGGHQKTDLISSECDHSAKSDHSRSQYRHSMRTTLKQAALVPTVAVCLAMVSNLVLVRHLSRPIQGLLSLDRERGCAKRRILWGVSVLSLPVWLLSVVLLGAVVSVSVCRLHPSLYFLNVIMCVFS